MKSYTYEHRPGILQLTWEDVARLSRTLAERLAVEEIELIVGIARAGLFPATTVACALRKELFPVRLTRRQNDVIVYPSPVWKVPVPDEVAGQKVAVIDESADTGETLRMVAAEARQRGATRVITTALVAHTWAEPPPDLCALETNAFVIFPWDREVLADGEWQLHPEYAFAFEQQHSNG
jgi:hypoxanthine phosphoribosyltransferase